MDRPARDGQGPAQGSPLFFDQLEASVARRASAALRGERMDDGLAKAASGGRSSSQSVYGSGPHGGRDPPGPPSPLVAVP